jgi:hypothetical protein
VTWELEVPRAVDLSAHTMNGGIRIEDVAGDIDFEAMNGGIRLLDVGGDDIDFPITVRGRLGRTLRTTLGGGGPTVRALTTKGAARIRRR